MRDTLHCPGCAAELRLPDVGIEQVQCPRCNHVFNATSRSSTAVATAGPIAPPRPEVEDHERFAPTPRVAMLHPPTGSFFAAALVLSLVANMAVFLLWACAFLDRTRMFADLLGWANDHRFLSCVEDAAGVAPWPALVAFFLWVLVATKNARNLNADGLLPHATLVLAFLCCFPGIILSYIHLQQLWRASDPYEIEECESWKNVRGSWMVRTWGALLFVAAPALSYISFRFDARGLREATFFCVTLSCVSIMLSCGLLIVIVHLIRRRQFERYLRLYEGPA
jgi:uncharacterized protein DUF4328